MSNDRFRFRAWNKKEAIYHYNAECAYDYMGGTPPLMDDSFGEVIRNEDYILEQCTGLKDKNGTLIFEGDVVECDLDNLRKNLIAQVVWYNGCFCMNRCGIVQKEVYGYYNIEIIGNIHDDQFREFTKMAENERD